MSESRFFQCLSDENRLEILRYIGTKERCVTDIVKHMRLDQPLVSHHLKALLNCGLVLNRQNGKKIMYRVADLKIISVIKKGEKIVSKLGKIPECATG